MTFDPFGDFETRGYLRNKVAEKDDLIVQALEQVSVETGIDEAFGYLNSRSPISYKDLLEVHRILFSAVYPWAGQDRVVTAPHLTINRAHVVFANPAEIRMAVDYGLRIGNDPARMRQQPGAVMGYLAYGHPFLDGNGRTLMVTHTVLAERAGISIDWAATSKVGYLEALTAEINDPRAGHLDAYLADFIAEPLGHHNLLSHLQAIKGLNSDGRPHDEAAASDTPEARERYEEQVLKYRHVYEAQDQKDEFGPDF